MKKIFDLNTSTQYDNVITNCRNLFEKKTIDYGTAWRILRLSSLTDQLYIKAKRIRSIEETGENRVQEAIDNEFVGLINYSIMALIQLEMNDFTQLEMEPKVLMETYDRLVRETKSLMENKNHDYGEAWRDMRVSSMTDLILMKLLRVKQIEENKGQTLVSEGLDANYQDIINYAVFALIKLSENKEL